MKAILIIKGNDNIASYVTSQPQERFLLCLNLQWPMLDRFLVNLKKKQKSCNMQKIYISKQMVFEAIQNLATYNTLAYKKKLFPSD